VLEDEDGKRGENEQERIQIRDMEIDDLAGVFHLGERLFTASDVPVLYRTWDELEVTSIYQNDSEVGLVANRGPDGELIGFALGTTITKRGSAWKYGHLIWLGVRPDQQRHRVGERLLEAFIERMLEMGVRLLLVDTEADNQPALDFFAKHGFGRPQNHVYLSLNLDDRRRGEAAMPGPGTGDG
jgi:ribosomal protein S18 acetylase RimI-like enzyme